MVDLTAEEEDLIFRSSLCPWEEIHLPYALLPNTTVIEAAEHVFYTKFNNTDIGKGSPSTKRVEEVLNSIVAVCICLFGIAGNLLNLLILSHRSWQVSLGRMERFVQSGLIALALSDLCFCVSYLPLGFVDQHQETYERLGFPAVYLAYCNAIISSFVVCSTMLTVTIALGRYFATVHPIRAREIFGMTFARRILFCVFVFCIIFNIPRFWFKQIRTVTCESDGSQFYYIYKHGVPHMFKMTYLCVYFVVAICIPFVVLAYCNIYLVKALRHSVSSPLVRRRCVKKHEEGSYRITLTLVIIVVAFFCLIVPAETFYFFRDVTTASGKNPDGYNLMVAFFSCIAAANFAFNFILYCAVNAHFRRTINHVLKCELSRLGRRKESVRFESVSVTSGTNCNNVHNNNQTNLKLVNFSSPRRTSVTEI